MFPSKSEQVASLLRTVPSVANRSPGDDSIFDVGLKLSDQKILTLRAELPSDFPVIPPILRILDPGATHPWLDSSGRVVGLSDVYSWDPRSSDLGVVVQKTLTEFCTRPPHINTAVQAAQKIKENWVQSLPTPTRQTSSDRIIQLTVPDSFAEIDELDLQRLQKLLDDDNEFSKFFASLNVVSNADQLLDSVRKGNFEKATENYSAASTITSLQGNIDKLQQALEESRRSVAALHGKQKLQLSPFEPKKLGESFEALARQIDEQSEELSLSLCADGAVDEDALRKFRASRVLYHLRKAKADRCRAQFNGSS